MADLYYRNGQYADGINSIRKNLQMNAYDAESNFLAGNLYRALNQITNAKEAYGWAARSMEYRSSAFAQIAEIYLIEKKWKLAIEYANKSLDFNRYNFNSHHVLIIANRKSDQLTESKKHIKRLLDLDPLNHFANLESYFLNPINKYWNDYVSLIKNEYPDQTHLELAISYYNRGLIQDALDLLINLSENNNPMIQLWTSYLTNNFSGLEPISSESSDFVFPYRRESIQALEWASQNNDQWEWTYYLALNYWAKDRDVEALKLMNDLETIPDHGPFYSARAYLRNKYEKEGIVEDLDRSILYDRDSWPIQLNAVKYYQDKDLWERALDLSEKANSQFPNNFNIEVMHAKSLLNLGRYDDCIDILKVTKVLPSEMARESRQLYEWAYIGKSIELIKNKKILAAKNSIQASREWPDNLGIGKPYKPDERLQNILDDYLDDTMDINGLKKRLTQISKESNSYNITLVKSIMDILK